MYLLDLKSKKRLWWNLKLSRIMPTVLMKQRKISSPNCKNNNSGQSVSWKKNSNRYIRLIQSSPTATLEWSDVKRWTIRSPHPQTWTVLTLQLACRRSKTLKNTLPRIISRNQYLTLQILEGLRKSRERMRANWCKTNTAKACRKPKPLIRLLTNHTTSARSSHKPILLALMTA